MPRFSVGFAKRKNTADEPLNAQAAPPEQPSFRVIERNHRPNVKSFDGGASMARASASLVPKSYQLDVRPEDDNIFADMKSNRGSGLSNTTKGTLTDNSSRHSNTSTAPSSTDVGGSGHIPDEKRTPPHHEPPDASNRTGSRTTSFLNKAGRTFSFGGQKKQALPPSPTNDEPPVPDLPPVLTLGSDQTDARSRGLTASTTSTVTTPQQPQGNGMDLGGDFGSMFTSFDKRASTATLTMDTSAARSLTANRNGQPGPTSPLSPDITAPGEPLLNPWNNSTSPRELGPPPAVPPHQQPPSISRSQNSGSFKYSNRHSDIVEDEDAKLLSDSFTAIKFLNSNDNNANTNGGRYRRDEDSSAFMPRKPISSTFAKEDNIFDGSLSRVTKVASNRYTSRAGQPPKNKVMTPAEFERYRQDKERQGTSVPTAKAAPKEEEDEDEINYDDDEDEQEKSKQQAKQRRKQEAHMTVYRQQMMKVTGETQPPISRPSLPSSMSAPQLSNMKVPSPVPQNGVSDEEDDEEVPLAILQAHGFPSKTRSPMQLRSADSNSNLRGSMHAQPARPSSALGDLSSSGPRRQSGLPAFARHLPQDPFIGASIAKPALRESLHFGDAEQTHQPQNHGPLPPGGLVGVIAHEERSRAMRRGSPNIENQRHMGGSVNGHPSPGFDPIAGIPHQMMYSPSGMQGMQGMPGTPGMLQMSPQMLSPGDQAQIQMTQQMQQFMQMQMQFMQMMAGSPNGGSPQMQQPAYNALGVNQPMLDASSRQSMMGDPMMEPNHFNQGMRTMSMVQPSSASFMQHPAMHPSPHLGYTPSIAPSERSNIGLPGRYRPVSHATTQSPGLDHHRRTSTMSGAITAFDDKSRSSMHLMNKAGEVSDDDDEEGWETMKAVREKKRSIWKSKKTLGGELNTVV